MAEQKIRQNTVGQISAGKYAGYYIVVIPKQSPGFDVSYTIYICTDLTFAFDPAVRECYDSWVQNKLDLESYFEYKSLDVRWDDSITPPQFGPPTPEMKSLMERFQARFDRASKDTTSGDS